MPRVNTPRLRLSIGFILMVGAILFAGCNAFKLGHSSDDKTITTQIQAKLFDDSVLKTRDIHVASDKGTVTLTGTVDTDLEKAAVERFANQTDGVKSVVNQLVVSSAVAAESPTMPPAETAEAAVPQTPAPAAAEPAPPRASKHRHHAVSPSSNEAPAEEAPQTPAASPAMTAQATPPPAVAPAPLPATPPAPVVKPPEQITIPAGTIFSIRMIDSIDSAQNPVGTEFAASLEAPVVVGERVVIPPHSTARVRLAQATSAGRMSGQSELKVELVSITAGGQTYPLETGYYEQAGASRSKRTAETVGGGAVLGALIGAIAGHGKGAAIGTVAGAGAGTAVEASTHGQQVKIPSETKLSFTLKSPVTVTMSPAGP